MNYAKPPSYGTTCGIQCHSEPMVFRPRVRRAHGHTQGSLVLACAALLGAALLAGCSGTVEDTIDRVLPERQPLYRSAKRLPPLEVPPGLSGASLDESLPVPEVEARETLVGSGGPSVARASAGAQTVAGSSGLLPTPEGVRLMRSGDQRWLLVDAPAEVVWPQVKEYFISEGLVIESEDPAVGILETEWAEQRSAMSSGFISRLFNNLNTSVFGPATRDRFRARLERGADPGTTEVYVSHRGAEEVVATDPSTRTRQADTAEFKVWQPRPSDPEIEAAVLSRLMVFIGVDEEAAETLVARAEAESASAPARARIVRDDAGTPVLVVEDDYARAWRRTGLALDRVGFTVENRDRAQGRYFVRYVDPDADVAGGDDEGFFSGLAFWRDDEPEPAAEYQVALADQGNRSLVMVLSDAGQPDQSETADRILGLLEEQLK